MYASLSLSLSLCVCIRTILYDCIHTINICTSLLGPVNVHPQNQKLYQRCTKWIHLMHPICCCVQKKIKERIKSETKTALFYANELRAQIIHFNLTVDLCTLGSWMHPLKHEPMGWKAERLKGRKVSLEWDQTKFLTFACYKRDISVISDNKRRTSRLERWLFIFLAFCVYTVHTYIHTHKLCVPYLTSLAFELLCNDVFN